MITTWVDDVIKQKSIDTIWLGVLLFSFYWLYFPLTCGALVVYEKVTAPYLGPKLKPLQRQMNNFVIYIQQALSNAFHLYLVWIIFMFLPAGLKRIVAISIGTVYPTICSITAVATEEIEDDTYWLTYWSVYGCLFLLMDVVEDFIGRIPGFYTLIIFTTVFNAAHVPRGRQGIPQDSSPIGWIARIATVTRRHYNQKTNAQRFRSRESGGTTKVNCQII